MKKYSVTYFKNHALRIMEEVSKDGGKIVLTKHGKPFVEVAPAQEGVEEFEFGALREVTTFHGDIVESVAADDWAVC